MIAPRTLQNRFFAWNRRWRAPTGSELWKSLLPPGLWAMPPFTRLVGAFAFQPNCSTRAYEYPWSFFTTAVEPGQVVLDIGGGLSGLAFVLSRAGARVTVVDPLVGYGGETSYAGDAEREFARINRGMGARAALRRTRLEDAGVAAESVDSIVSISVLEHLAAAEAESLLAAIARVLKPGGRLILTVDLFLNLEPFTSRQRNEYGTNLRVAELFEASGLELVIGSRAELYGYPEFDAETILASLERYQLGVEYPVVPQLAVLAKSPGRRGLG